MSIPRKDVRSTLDADVFEQLEILREAAGLTQAKWIERELVPIIERKIHDAKVIAARAQLIGETRKPSEEHGTGRHHAARPIGRHR